MARTEEKAKSMLNRWMTQKNEQFDKNSVSRQKQREMEQSNRQRPHTSECHVLADAERYRRYVIRLFIQNIAKIQDTAQPEATVKEINDHLNKLLREKGYWEKRIVELGGVNYKQRAAYAAERARSRYNNNNSNNNNNNNSNSNSNVDDDEFAKIRSQEDAVVSGYIYFGAARDLPGVKELLEHEKAAKVEEKNVKMQANKRSRKELYRLATAEYYGYRDDDDENLAAEELKEELRNGLINEEQYNHAKSKHLTSYDVLERTEAEHVPTQDEMKVILLNRKKEEMLKQLQAKKDKH